jgi:hypothetical protein
MVTGSNAEALVERTLFESLGSSIDAVLFSDTPGTDEQPGGLLAGIAPLPPSVAANPIDAMTEDLAKLGAAVSAFAGNGQVAFIGSLAQMITMLLRIPQPELGLLLATERGVSEFPSSLRARVN